MKRKERILKLCVFSMLVAFGVVISPLLRIEGMCPMAHFVNILCAVLMGPWYSLLCAMVIAFLRMSLMGIPPLAVTGAVFGAFFSGVFYRLSRGKIICAVLGEVFGTGIVGAIVSYPVMAFVFGKEGLTPFFYVPSFLMGTIIGGSIAFVFLVKLSHSGMLAKFQKALSAKVFDKVQKSIIRKIKEKNPLIHCISNKISANACANLILAIGGRAYMAEHPKEVEETAGKSDALLVSLGNISDTKITAVMISLEKAKKAGIPCVCDVVGASASDFKRKLSQDISEKYKPDIIKGNYSEIYALYDTKYKKEGIDSDKNLSKENVENACRELSEKYGSVVLASGSEDIVCKGGRITYIKNGTPKLSKITGTGCMLGAICALCLTCEDSFSAAEDACAIMGICGERAYGKCGTFSKKLFDNFSSINDKILTLKIKKEVI